MNKRMLKKLEEGIKKYSDPELINAAMEDFLFYVDYDKGRPHRKLSSFSRKWIEKWVESTNGCANEETPWFFDLETWYTFRPSKSGKMVNGEEFVPGEIILDGGDIILKPVYSGPSKFWEQNRKKLLKQYDALSVRIPIKEIGLVLRKPRK